MKKGDKMDIMERVSMLKLCNMTDDIAHQDIITIIKIFREYDIELTEENAGIMITHLAAAFKRNTTGESINPLAETTITEIKQDPQFPKSEIIFKNIASNIKNKFNQTEEEFAKLHICTLLNNII